MQGLAVVRPGRSAATDRSQNRKTWHRDDRSAANGQKEQCYMMLHSSCKIRTCWSKALRACRRTSQCETIPCACLRGSVCIGTGLACKLSWLSPNCEILRSCSISRLFALNPDHPWSVPGHLAGMPPRMAQQISPWAAASTQSATGSLHHGCCYLQTGSGNLQDWDWMDASAEHAAHASPSQFSDRRSGMHRGCRCPRVPCRTAFMRRESRVFHVDSTDQRASAIRTRDVGWPTFLCSLVLTASTIKLGLLMKEPYISCSLNVRRSRPSDVSVSRLETISLKTTPAIQLRHLDSLRPKGPKPWISPKKEQ